MSKVYYVFSRSSWASLFLFSLSLSLTLVSPESPSVRSFKTPPLPVSPVCAFEDEEDHGQRRQRQVRATQRVQRRWVAARVSERAKRGEPWESERAETKEPHVLWRSGFKWALKNPCKSWYINILFLSCMMFPDWSERGYSDPEKSKRTVGTLWSVIAWWGETLDMLPAFLTSGSQ